MIGLIRNRVPVWSGKNLQNQWKQVKNLSKPIKNQIELGTRGKNGFCLDLVFKTIKSCINYNLTPQMLQKNCVIYLYLYYYFIHFVPTRFDVRSREFCKCENLLWGQTKEEFFAPCFQDHLQRHLFVMCMASLPYCPRTQNPAHHDYYHVNLAAYMHITLNQSLPFCGY